MLLLSKDTTTSEQTSPHIYVKKSLVLEEMIWQYDQVTSNYVGCVDTSSTVRPVLSIFIDGMVGNCATSDYILRRFEYVSDPSQTRRDPLEQIAETLSVGTGDYFVGRSAGY